jgi:ATP-dependent RNA helicase DeaD
VLIVPPKLVRKAENLLRIAKIEAEWTVAPTADEILSRDEERLLADPIWTEEVTEELETFASKLLALHSPERIAAAYLRLYRSRQSAPEELGWPDAPSEPKVRKEFGPSEWFVLSVGRNDRAEARWLLPMLCRAGNITKDAIGAIRVQPTETYVELAKESAAGFLAALGEAATLGDGITVRRSDGPPDRPLRGAGSSKAGQRKPRPAVSEGEAPRSQPSPADATGLAEAATGRPVLDEPARSAPERRLGEAALDEPSAVSRLKPFRPAPAKKSPTKAKDNAGPGERGRKAVREKPAVTPAKIAEAAKRSKATQTSAEFPAKGQASGKARPRPATSRSGASKPSKR